MAVTTLVIDRGVWLTGRDLRREREVRDSYWENWPAYPMPQIPEFYGNACLLRQDGKMCCLGMYLQQCGVAKKHLLGVEAPRAVERTLPKQAQWLVESLGSYPNVADELMDVNDDMELTPKQREGKIRKLFEKMDIQVEFVGEYPKLPSMKQARKELEAA